MVYLGISGNTLHCRSDAADPGWSIRVSDIVLVAGKGHEKVQITREGAAPFDDVEVAREALGAVGFECEAAGAGVKSALAARKSAPTANVP